MNSERNFEIGDKVIYAHASGKQVVGMIYDHGYNSNIKRVLFADGIIYCFVTDLVKLGSGFDRVLDAID